MKMFPSLDSRKTPFEVVPSAAVPFEVVPMKNCSLQRDSKGLKAKKN
jgi:hypothetical protein